MSAKDIVSFIVKAYQLFYCDEDDEEDDDSSSDEEESHGITATNDRRNSVAAAAGDNDGLDNNNSFNSVGKSSTRQYVLIDNTLARNDGQFKAQFRMNRSTVESLCCLLERCMSNSNMAHMGRPSLPVQTQLLVAIWVLVTQDSYREVSQRFDVAKSTAIKCVHCVCSALLELADSFVTWPTEEQAAVIAENFRRQSGFPSVIGCIARVRIPTKVFSERLCQRSAESTKSAPYVVLQAVCDDKMMFTDCFASHIGTAQNKDFQKLYKLDSVLRRSPDELCYGKYQLLGDESYPLSASLLTPYSERGYLTKCQRRYNGCHSSTKSVVDRAFELLRARFRRLAFIDMNVPQMVRVTVQATCVLHNYCLLHNDHAYEFLGTSGRRPRRQLTDDRVPPLEIPDWHDDEAAGQAKRTEIERLLK